MNWQKIKDFFRPNGRKLIVYALVFPPIFLGILWLTWYPSLESIIDYIVIIAPPVYLYACALARNKYFALIIPALIILFMILTGVV